MSRGEGVSKPLCNVKGRGVLSGEDGGVVESGGFPFNKRLLRRRPLRTGGRGDTGSLTGVGVLPVDPR